MTSYTTKPHFSGKTPTDIVTYRYNDELVYVPTAPNYPVSLSKVRPRWNAPDASGSSKRSRMYAKRSRSSRNCATHPSPSPSPPPCTDKSLSASAHWRGRNSLRTCRATKSSTSTSRRANVHVPMWYRYRISQSRMQMRMTRREWRLSLSRRRLIVDRNRTSWTMRKRHIHTHVQAYPRDRHPCLRCSQENGTGCSKSCMDDDDA